MCVSMCEGFGRCQHFLTEQRRPQLWHPRLNNHPVTSPNQFKISTCLSPSLKWPGPQPNRQKWSPTPRCTPHHQPCRSGLPCTRFGPCGFLGRACAPSLVLASLLFLVVLSSFGGVISLISATTGSRPTIITSCPLSGRCRHGDGGWTIFFGCHCCCCCHSIRCHRFPSCDPHHSYHSHHPHHPQQHQQHPQHHHLLYHPRSSFYLRVHGKRGIPILNPTPTTFS
jgi:hypothetical protein